MKVKLLKPIDGFEDVAEYRVPQENERHVRSDGRVYLAFKSHPREELVVTTIKRWRQATIDDAAEALTGERILSRFRSHEFHDWEEGYLAGAVLHESGIRWMRKDGRPVLFCEVLVV